MLQAKTNNSIQSRLRIGQADGQYEKQADRIAKAVMRMPDTTVQRQPVDDEDESLQMRPLVEEEEKLQMQVVNEEEELQMQSIEEEKEELQMKLQKDGAICPECRERRNQSRELDCPDCEKILSRQQEVTAQNGTPQPGEALNRQLKATKGKGSRLPDVLKSEMSAKMGADFSGVNVHTNDEAVQMNRRLGARAFTHGTDVYFNSGQYNPASADGKHLLAHELTHVIQQNGYQQEIQRKIGDGHDLTSPRFSLNPDLEAAYDDEKIIKKGATGIAVKKIQHAIHDLGLLGLKYGVDGDFGSETKKAVEAFQSQKGLKDDGIVGDKTMTELDKAFPGIAKAKLPSGPFKSGCMLSALCHWNEHMVKELATGTPEVIIVDDIYWNDVEYDGKSWNIKKFPGGGGYNGVDKIRVLKGNCEDMTNTLYHEYQHHRKPERVKSSWAENEQNAYELEARWAAAMGLPTEKGMITQTKTGEKQVDTKETDKVVDTYPGISTGTKEEILERVGADKVRVKLSDGSKIVRKAKKGDLVPGKMRIVNPNSIDKKHWNCP